MTSVRETFLASLADLDVPADTVPQSELPGAIRDAVVEPAVGIADGAAGEDRPAPVDWDPTPASLDRAASGVTGAAFAIADYGSVVLPSSPPAAELVGLFVDRHVVVVPSSAIVPDMAAAVDRLDRDVPDAYGDAIIATGPSATADMGALVTGAHGPSEVRVIVVEAA